MQINIPKTSLVLLVGVSGSGKSSFAKKHFEKYEIISSDVCRGIVSNDENNQSATNEAFEVFNFILSKRLQNGLLTVADATNIQQEARKKLLNIARSFHILPVAIVFDLPEELCEKKKRSKNGQKYFYQSFETADAGLKTFVKEFKKEGFKKLYILRSEEEVNSVTEIVREKLYNDKTDMHGPFDIIGDVHGCYDELVELLQKLNYKIDSAADDGKNYGLQVSHPENRMAVFLGDLVDRGPASPKVLKLVMSMVQNGSALCVPGNHDMKLHKKLNGKTVQEKHGLAETLQQLETESEEFKHGVKEFLYGLVSHYVLDSGKLVVAHAGLKEEMHGRGSGAVRSFCLYGETTGETDEFGLPVRYNWASEYRGRAKVVYGHTPVPAAEWLNNTIDIDTGCVFGGALTALRYPEEELVSVQAKKVYAEPVKPLGLEENKDENQNNIPFSLQNENDDLLDIEDVTGRRIIQTRLKNNILIREEQSIAALEAVSRFAVNPKWLIYLPPTMSPSETSSLENFLEHPIEAIDYYKSRGVKKIILEEKHMGSRAVLIICKDIQTAEKRFGITNEGLGVCYTRTGRNFFNDSKIEKEFLTKVQRALTLSNFWEKHSTDWVCLDAELMPWSVKAQSLIHDQYAATGSSAINALSEAEKILTLTKIRGVEGAENLSAAFTQKKIAVEKFIDSYRNYCWEVKSIDDYKLAPFHILATEDFVHTDKNHEWHMENIKEICLADKTLFKITPYKIVNVENEDEIKDAVNWWLSLTQAGGEGMVIKPFDFVFYAEKHGLVQPAVKCRGKEYLRIIYGPEYCEKENLDRLKKRGLAKKRALALQEFALGIEALERFVKKEPLRRVHESALRSSSPRKRSCRSAVVIIRLPIFYFSVILMNMSNIRKMPIGIQSFEKLITNGFFYVDKTEYIWNMIKNPVPYFLSRPRRFGKSLFLSTLKAYFLGQKELFKGLAIEKLEESEKDKREIWQEYPVLYLDFNIGVYDTNEGLLNRLNSFLQEYEKIYGSTGLDLPDRFQNLIRTACEKTGKQTVILIDEYDKPLLQTMWKDEHLNEIYRTILKSFFGVIKSADQYLRFVFLTGGTKFSKVSIFSDLNNLRDLSLLPDYSALCGISQEELEEDFKPEIRSLAEKNDISYEDVLTKLKQRYDGYKFSEIGKNMYNPFSLLNVFAAGRMRDYWFATGTPTFLVNYLKRAHYNIPDLDGNVKMNEAGLETYRADAINPLPILFQSGYLTIKDYNDFSRLYRLGFPNDEVRYGFLDNLLPAYTPIRTDKTGLSIWEFYEQIEAGDVDGLMQKMKGIISGIPYDNFTEKDLTLREQNYQTAVYLVFALMNQFVHTEVHCATGRADCIVELKDKVYIFEFKLISTGTAEDAIKQIKDKNYAGKYSGSGKKIIIIGTNFDEKKRTFQDWKIEEL